MQAAATARLERLLTARQVASIAFRAELALLALFSLGLVPLALARGGDWLWLIVPACAAQAGTAVCWARMARGERRHALAHAAGLLALCFLAFVALAPRLVHYRTLTVLSGSMRPTFNPGDLIVVTPEAANDLRVGQVLSYQIPVGDHHVVSHRIVRIVSEGLRPVVVTKGDANTAADPWQARLDGGPFWRYRFHLPWLGYLIAWLRDPLLRTISVLVVPAALALLAILKVWQVKLPSKLLLRWRGEANARA